MKLVIDTDIDNPVVKIIVPVFNTARYLRRCLDSILAQSYKYFWLIVVDDGSTDGSGDICDEYQENDSRVVAIHQSNKGLSYSRNVGIDYSIGCQYITFIDSDDYVHPKYLEDLVIAVRDTGCQIAIAKHMRFSDSVPEKLDENLIVNPYSPEQCYCMKEISTTPAWGKIFANNLLSQLRFPEGKIHEDYYFTWKAIFSVEKIAVIDKCLYYYFNNPNGIMHSQWKPCRMDVFPALDEKIIFFKSNGFYEALNRAIHKKERLIDKHLDLIKNLPYKDEFQKRLEGMKGDTNV